MIHLLSAAGRAALGDFIDQGTLLAFDLDGTLAPIVVDPAGIMIPEEIRERLICLNRMAPVAIITGRARADAQRHLGFQPRFLVGNHGAEGLPGRERQEEEFYRKCGEWRDQLELLMPKASKYGIVMENKGATLSLHYRRCFDPDAAKSAILRAIRRLQPAPRRVSGKFVENIVPPDAPHKGDALLQIMRQTGCSRAVFIGDDATDEDVFRLADDRILGVRIGCESASLAGYCLSDQEEMLELLNEMVSLKTLQGKVTL